MMELSEIYGPKYHLGIKRAYEGAVAEKMYRAILSVFPNVSTVIELGCSCGVFLEPFYRDGCEVHGVDGDRTAFIKRNRSVPKEYLEVHDLREPYYPSKQYDVCVCMETLEHIERGFRDVVLDSICRCSDNLFIIAAAPGQGGIGHVSLRPISEWVDDFHKRGFRKRRGRLPSEVADWPTLLVLERKE